MRHFVFIATYLGGKMLVAKLNSHVGGVNSAHSQAVKKGEDLLKEKQHIQRISFRGHDESQGSSDKGNFLELVQFLGDHNESINEVLQTTPKNCKLTHPDIQKDIVNAIARETSKAIIKDLDNGFFSILVDESHDISVKEQMSLVLYYVNKKGIIIERFLGIVHVAISNLVTVVGDSCKRRDALRDAQFAKIKENLENGVRRSGQVIDMQLQELNNRFSEANTDLLLCMACLNPSNSFVAFDKEKLIRLAKFYPSDFLGTDILALDSQLQNYIFDMRNNDFFLEL
ncbi:uncharacterized protein LOC126700944 [Quercus robur]|uniref:uncharacterized protein LOC126700944 n=1 Tax=Quercus robur TaxID=38942 RepID=UPI0021629387|nr:uncharacterized protein LOC126700944 [Quercus robur]